MEKRKMLLKPNNEFSNIYPSSCSDSYKSILSSKKEGCESPLSSRGSQNESDIQPINKCLSRLEPDDNVKDGLLCKMYKKGYDEEALRVTDSHCRPLDEIMWQKLKLKEEELHNLKEFSSEAKSTNLVEQLETVNEQLKDENAILRKKLESKSCETHQLQCQLNEAQENMAESELEIASGRKNIQILEHLVTIYEQEVQKLKSRMLNSQAKFSLEKDELHFDIASLLKTKIELTSRLADSEFRNKELENKIMQYEAEILKQEELHATQKTALHDEISYLWEELGQRMQDLEAANKTLYKVLIERDEANAKVDKLEFIFGI